VEVYVTREDTYLVYVHFRKNRGEIIRADFVEVDQLDSFKIRDCLKEAGVYPGIMYFEAILHSRYVPEPVP